MNGFSLAAPVCMVVHGPALGVPDGLPFRHSRVMESRQWRAPSFSHGQLMSPWRHTGGQHVHALFLNVIHIGAWIERDSVEIDQRSAFNLNPWLSFRISSSHPATRVSQSSPTEIHSPRPPLTGRSSACTASVPNPYHSEPSKWAKRRTKTEAMRWSL